MNLGLNWLRVLTTKIKPQTIFSGFVYSLKKREHARIRNHKFYFCENTCERNRRYAFKKTLSLTPPPVLLASLSYFVPHGLGPIAPVAFFKDLMPHYRIHLSIYPAPICFTSMTKLTVIFQPITRQKQPQNEFKMHKAGSRDPIISLSVNKVCPTY